MFYSVFFNYKYKMIVIDWEFSGLDHKKHWLLSLWAVDLNNPENQFYDEARLEEWMTFTEEALKVNGFKEKDLYDTSKQSIAEMIIKFDTWLKTCWNPQILIGQNPKSDIDFLVESYKLADLEYPLGHRSLDTHSIVFMKHLQLWKEILIERGMYKINLDESLRFVWIKWGEPRPHNALTGAKCEAEVISRVIYGKKLLPEFEDIELPVYLKQ